MIDLFFKYRRKLYIEDEFFLRTLKTTTKSWKTNKGTEVRNGFETFDDLFYVIYR